MIRAENHITEILDKAARNGPRRHYFFLTGCSNTSSILESLLMPCAGAADSVGYSPGCQRHPSPAVLNSPSADSGRQAFAARQKSCGSYCPASCEHMRRYPGNKADRNISANNFMPPLAMPSNDCSFLPSAIIREKQELPCADDLRSQSNQPSSSRS